MNYIPERSKNRLLVLRSKIALDEKEYKIAIFDHFAKLKIKNLVFRT